MADVAEESRFESAADVRRFIAALDPLLPSDSEPFANACLVWSLLCCGPDEERLACFLDLPQSFVAERLARLRRYGVIRGELLRLDWEEEGGEIAFWMDCAVAEGELSRLERGGKLLYRTTKRARARFAAAREAEARRSLVAASDRNLAALFDRIGLRGPQQWREREKARAVRFLLMLAEPRVGLREIAARSGSNKTSLLRCSAVLTERGLIRQVPEKRGHRHMLSRAGQRLVGRLAALYA